MTGPADPGAANVTHRFGLRDGYRPGPENVDPCGPPSGPIPIATARPGGEKAARFCSSC